MRLHLIILSACLLLTSCNSGRWINRTKPMTSLDADMGHCQQKATAQFPIKTYYRAGPSHTRVSTMYGARGITVKPDQQADIQLQDVNEDVRDNAFKKCMHNLGWNLEYDNKKG